MTEDPTKSAESLPDVADAYLVQWTVDGEVWAEAHASYVPAFDAAQRHGGAVEDLYLASTFQTQIDDLRIENERLRRELAALEELDTIVITKGALKDALIDAIKHGREDALKAGKETT